MKQFTKVRGPLARQEWESPHVELRRMPRAGVAVIWHLEIGFFQERETSDLATYWVVPSRGWWELSVA